MNHSIKRRFAHDQDPAAGSEAHNQETLAQRSRMHALQLELSQRDQTIANLQDELERLRARQDRLLQDALNARLDRLYTALAAPAVQLATQDHMVAQGKELQARDVLAVARRMLRELARSGLVLEAAVGSCVAYDPARHTLTGAQQNVQPGQPVLVRFSGAVLDGRLLHKAVVEAEQACPDV